MSETFTYETGTAGPQGSGSLLDEIRAELEKPLPEQTIKVKVPRRPQYSVTFDTRLPWDKVKLFNRLAKHGDKIDELQVMVSMMCDLCECIEREGKGIVTEIDGTPLIFSSPTFVDLMQAANPYEALRKFFDRDADFMAAARTIEQACGYSAGLLPTEEQALDPTDTSND